MPKKSQKSSIAKKHEERVMVVSRNDLFANGIWHGLKSDNLPKYVNTINSKHKFLARGEVEVDARWQQIIPYLVFEHEGRIFLMRRKGEHTDKRLANKYSIGIGGHINRRDMNGQGLMGWARREFSEEIDYEGNYKANFLGIINDDSNDVGLVHAGLVIHLVGDSDKIKVRDEHKSGDLVSLSELSRVYKNMETWSQIIYDYLINNKLETRNRKPEVKNSSNSNIHGILPDHLIADYIQNKTIVISPLPANWRENIDQVSIDFHLGGNIKLFRAGAYRFIDTRRGLPEDAMEEINLDEGDPFILEPGAFAIASTSEVLKLPADILGRLEGKSSLARLGILVHSTAARFDPGWNGAPVLELGNLGPKPAILYCGMAICAFTFERLAAPVRMEYEGSRSDRYSGSRKAVASKIHKA